MKFFFIFRCSIEKYFDKWEAFCPTLPLSRPLSISLLLFLSLSQSQSFSRHFFVENFLLFSNGKSQPQTHSGPVAPQKPKDLKGKRFSPVIRLRLHVRSAPPLCVRVSDLLLDREFVLFKYNHSKCKLRTRHFSSVRCLGKISSRAAHSSNLVYRNKFVYTRSIRYIYMQYKYTHMLYS